MDTETTAMPTETAVAMAVVVVVVDHRMATDRNREQGTLPSIPAARQATWAILTA